MGENYFQSFFCHRWEIIAHSYLGESWGMLENFEICNLWKVFLVASKQQIICSRTSEAGICMLTMHPMNLIGNIYRVHVHNYIMYAKAVLIYMTYE